MVCVYALMIDLLEPITVESQYSYIVLVLPEIVGMSPDKQLLAS